MKRLLSSLLILLAFSTYGLSATWSATNIVFKKSSTDVFYTANVLRDGVPTSPPTTIDGTVKSQGEIEPAITAKLKVFAETEAFSGASVPSTITYVPPPTPMPPTATELATAKFLTDWNLYKGYLAFVKLGFLSEGDKLLTDLAAIIQAELTGHEAAYGALVGGITFVP